MKILPFTTSTCWARFEITIGSQ